ncbi:MAG: hypothetical protein KC585_00065 [Candidatus Magasanikbacteria bacterium]|nr:hypothetical protein [Candidatus Magasanikbacteria bacterium]
MKKQMVFPLLLLVAIATSVAAAPATEAAIFRTTKGIKITRLKQSQAFGSIANSSNGSVTSAGRSAIPEVVSPMGGGIAPSMLDSKMIAPYPGEDRDYTQLETDYHWAGELPSMPASADVYHVIRAKIDTGLTKSLLKSAGLPSSLADALNDVQSLNASWKGKNGITWNFDATSNNLSWWKENTLPQDAEGQPTLDKDRAINVAQDFVKAHGLSSYVTTAPELENAPWIMPLMEQSSMPCPVTRSEGVTASESDAMPIMIEPSVEEKIAPCFWYPRTVNIVYPDKRDGKRVTDAWSGYPQQALTVTVSLDTYEVTGGYANLPTSLEASSYPMIDKGAVEEALKNGGRSPYYGWGKKGTRVQIQYDAFELVVMRYDSWKDNKNETYFVPALLATGKVDAGDGNGLNDYRTIVPLIKAEFLEDVPSPIMYMKGDVTSGSEGTVTNMMAPAPDSAPAPAR